MTETQFNLPDALQHEAGRIAQLLFNTGHWLFGSGPAREFEYGWPSHNAVTYALPDGGAQLLLTDVRVVDFGPILWSEEREIRRHREEHVLSKIKLLKGQEVTDNFEWTFTKTKSLQEVSKLGFEQSIEAHLGSFNTPAGAKVEAKFEQEFSTAIGSSDTTSNTISRKITNTGPLNAEIVATRDSIEAQRTTRCQPQFDYAIAWQRGWQGGTSRVTWKDKEEYLSFVRGTASDDVGVLHTAVGNQTRNLAPYFRAHAQPNAEIPHGAPYLNWTDRYSSSISLNIETKGL